MNIVIMGATSHIAKGLIERFLNRGTDTLNLFSRSPGRVRQFLQTINRAETEKCLLFDGYSDFLSGPYDLIINCIGVETRNSHDCDFTLYFSVTEEFDNLAISYLKSCNPAALYISFSSGAVYGKGFSQPVDDDSTNCLQVNHLAQQDYYGIARINAEAKHRAHHDFNIVDLRIFSYFSRYINLSDGYFITDVLESILNNRTLVTDNSNIIRDYINPEDLFSMIIACTKAIGMNRAFDLYSTSPVSKLEILDYFSSVYGLKYESRSVAPNSSATGTKANYYSTCRHAATIGFVPRFSSMDSVTQEAGYLLTHQAIR